MFLARLRNSAVCHTIGRHSSPIMMQRNIIRKTAMRRITSRRIFASRSFLLLPLFCVLLVTGAVTQPDVSSPRFAAVDAIVRQAIDEHQVPGAGLVVGHDGSIVYRKAFCDRSLEPTVEPMTLDTIFDMASL